MRQSQPWPWIAACAVLVLVAGGMTLWALSLQADLEDQRELTQQAQQQAEEAQSQVNTLSEQVDELKRTVTDAFNQLGSDAKARVQSLLDRVQDAIADLRGPP